MAYSDNISMCWALMPLSSEELQSVPDGHTIRPYLLLKAEDDFYWAFPCTSNAFSKKSRYTNNTLLIRSFSYEKSLVLLDKVYKLPFDNLRGNPVSIYKEEENSLIKRLKASSKFMNYPNDVVDFITRANYSLDYEDMISHNDELYVVIGKVPNKGIYYSLKVYNHEVDGTIFREVDTNKYYVDCNDVHCIVPNETTEYVTEMYGLFYGRLEKTTKDLKELLSSIQREERVCSDLSEEDFTKLGKLPVGTVISYMQDDNEYKMVILDRDKKNTVGLFGLENQMYKDFELGVFPNDYNFPFSIISTLNDERVSQLINRKKSNGKGYVHKKSNS